MHNGFVYAYLHTYTYTYACLVLAFVLVLVLVLVQACPARLPMACAVETCGRVVPLN